MQIICKRVRYYTEIDEDYFFEWLKLIPSIYKIDGQHDELYLHFSSEKITEADIQNLLALFKRYKIPNIKQLKVFQKK